MALLAPVGGQPGQCRQPSGSSGCFSWRRTGEKNESTPVVTGDAMFVTGSLGHLWALDSRTGQLLWSYKKELPDRLRLCCGPVNRGIAFAATRSSWERRMPTSSPSTPGTEPCAGTSRWHLRGRLQHHGGAADHRQAGHHRGRRWRIRRTGIHRFLRHGYGQAAVALPMRSRSRMRRDAVRGAATPRRPAARPRG